MRWRGYRGRERLRLVAACVVLALLGGPALAGEGRSAAELANDPQWLIFPAQDESSAEELAGRYLRLRGVTFTSEYLDVESTDLILRVPYDLGDVPDIDVVIDTDPAARDDDGAVVERRFIFRILFEMTDPPTDDEDRLALLNYCNNFMDVSWAPDRVYLYQDEILIFESSLNMPHPDVPIHGEMVYDVCARMAGGFNNFYSDAPFTVIRMMGGGQD